MAAALFANSQAAPTSTAVLSAASGATVVKSGNYYDAHGKLVGGWAELAEPAPGTAVTFTPTTTVSEGGGTWTYGTYVDSGGLKHCWSFYYHPSYEHHATADMGTGQVRVYAAQGQWAKAEPQPFDAKYTTTCNVYWSLW